MNRPAAGREPGPIPEPAKRKALSARGNALKAKLALGHQGLSEAFVVQVRVAFTHTDLLKIRLAAEGLKETKDLAAELARRVPCHLLQCTGRVALLYLPLPKGC
ncbi:MAG: YhbY family RNA-binding protein [Phycisphaerae bacterium]|nr:YhbY family RNA-binding protein [Phycisphaerae bacterium]